MTVSYLNTQALSHLVPLRDEVGGVAAVGIGLLRPPGAHGVKPKFPLTRPHELGTRSTNNRLLSLLKKDSAGKVANLTVVWTATGTAPHLSLGREFQTTDLCELVR